MQFIQHFSNSYSFLRSLHICRILKNSLSKFRARDGLVILFQNFQSIRAGVFRTTLFTAARTITTTTERRKKERAGVGLSVTAHFTGKGGGRLATMGYFCFRFLEWQSSELVSAAG